MDAQEAEESVVEEPKSAEDKIADLMFGDDEPDEVEEQEASDEASDDEPEEQEASDDSEEAEYVEMEIDGSLYEVPATLKDHILRQQDYTKKTQEVAQQKRDVETRMAQVATQQKQFEFLESVKGEVSQIQQIDSAIPQYREYLRDNIEQLSSSDIEKVRFQIDELQSQRNTIAQAIQTKTHEFQQAQEQSQRELLEKSTDVLRAKIPKWQEVGAEVDKFVLSLGFTEQQLQQARLDPVQMQLAHDAWKYRQLKDGSTAAVAKVKSAPQIKAKARNPMPKEVKDKLNLRKRIKSPNVSQADKAEMIGASIADKFF